MIALAGTLDRWRSWEVVLPGGSAGSWRRPVSETLLSGRGDPVTVAVRNMLLLEELGYPPRLRGQLAYAKADAGKPRNAESSTSTASAKNKMSKTPKTPKSRATGSNGVSLVVHEFPDSDSTFDKLYRDPAFRLEWDNDLPFHIGIGILRLRKARGLTQAELAAAAGTTQARIARIEAASQNFTVETLMRIVQALDAHVLFTIEPAENIRGPKGGRRGRGRVAEPRRPPRTPKPRKRGV